MKEQKNKLKGEISRKEEEGREQINLIYKPQIIKLEAELEGIKQKSQ
jgi:hypothetical protein